MKFWNFGKNKQGQLPFSELRERVRISKDRTVLLVCMGISLMFWFFVKMSQEYESSRIVHLQYVLPPAMEFIESPPDQLKANIYGTGIDLLANSIFKQHTTVIFYLNELAEKSISKQAIINKIEELVSVEVTDVNPSYITIEMDSSASRMVPVKFISDIDFVQDFSQTDSIILTPDSVMVTGAPEILAQIPFIPTKQLQFSNVQKPIRRKLPLDISGEGLFKVFPGEVEVLVPVEQFVQKTFDVPIEVLKEKNNLRLIPSSAVLKSSVPLSKYEQTTGADFLLGADFSASLNLADQNTVPIHLVKAPAWAKHVYFEPKAVEYYIVQ